MKKAFIIIMLLSLGAVQASQSENQLVSQSPELRKFFDACQKGDLTEVKALAESNTFDINTKCERFLTGACRAAMFGRKEVFEYLVNQGVSSEFKAVVITNPKDSEWI